MADLRFSANLGMLWPGLPAAEAIDRAAAAGFTAIELHWPDPADIPAIGAALTRNGLPLLGLNTARGDVAAGEFGLSALPGQADRARAEIDRAFAMAAALGARAVHVMAGKAQGDAAQTAFVAALRHASDLGAGHGITVLIEPLNHIDVPGYFLTDPRHAARLIAATGRDNIRVMLDCYHMGRSGLDPLAVQLELGDLVGHVQFAAVPDRSEPDHGDIDYPDLLPQMVRAGYRGWFGAEYRPRSLTEHGLQWLRDMTQGRDCSPPHAGLA